MNKTKQTSHRQFCFHWFNCISFYKFLQLFKHQLFFTLFGSSFSCHQIPSCSRYTLIQIKKNGTIIGLLQGLWRSVNCHHFRITPIGQFK